MSDKVQNSLGYGQHGDYVFGWKDNSLQKAMDSGCYLRNCTQLTALPIKVKNKCQVPASFKENLDSCRSSLPLLGPGAIFGEAGRDD